MSDYLILVLVFVVVLLFAQLVAYCTDGPTDSMLAFVGSVVAVMVLVMVSGGLAPLADHVRGVLSPLIG